MATNDFKHTPETELRNLANDKREALRAFRFGVAGSKTRNIREGRNLKRDIARIETELNARKK